MMFLCGNGGCIMPLITACQESCGGNVVSCVCLLVCLPTGTVSCDHDTWRIRPQCTASSVQGSTHPPPIYAPHPPLLLKEWWLVHTCSLDDTLPHGTDIYWLFSTSGWSWSWCNAILFNGQALASYLSVVIILYCSAYHVSLATESSIKDN